MMTSDIHSAPCTGDAPNSTLDCVPSGLAQLPIEIVVDTMKYLYIEDLRRLSATCRRFKVAAYHGAGLAIQNSVHITNIDLDRCSRHLTALSDLTTHALQHDLRIDLSFHCNLYDRIGRTWEAYDELHPLIEDVFAAVERALPLLVRLSISAPDFFRAKLYPFLCSPAPHLRQLSIDRGSMDQKRAHACPVPVGLFGGSAPKLIDLDLHHVVPSEQPITAFASVRRARLVYELPTPAIRLAGHFPSLAKLKVGFRTNSDSEDDDSEPPIDFCGLALKRLTVFDYEDDDPLFPVIESMLAVHTIPFVRQYSDSPDWRASVWEAIPGPLRLRVMDNGGGNDDATLVTIVPEDGSGRVRKYEFAYWDRDDGTPLNELHFLGARFTYIRMENEFIIGLLRFNCALPALRRLWIDLPTDSWVRGVIMPDVPLDDDSDDSDDSASNYARRTRTLCAALENVTIFAMDEVMEINALHVRLLGQALGQDSRAPKGRASLTLVGVKFMPLEDLEETMSELLPLVFSSIDYREFTANDSKEARELGLWDV